MSRKLYYVSGSIPNWRVLIALYEKELPFELCRLKVMQTRQTRSPEFLAINPRGQTPALVEPDGSMINESLAILSYLELRYPDPTLLERGENLGKTLAWMQEAEATACVYEPIEQLFISKELSEEQKQRIGTALIGLDWELGLWESRVEHTFIAGAQFSLADCALYPVLAYLKRRGCDFSSYPRLEQYMKVLAVRLSIQKSLPEGWQYPPRRKLFAEARALLAG